MSDKLKVDIQILNDEAFVVLQGKIDEDAVFQSVLDLKQRKYVFDFEKITMLNSCGIRQWISFVEELPRDIDLVYKNCPKIIIEQISMVKGFIREGATIESLYAPYFCEKCDKEEMVLLKGDDVDATNPPSVNCKECSGEMEFDDIPEQYFSFATRK